MQIIYKDLSPAYIPFIVQATKGDGDKSDPTVDNLIIYEEDGGDTAWSSSQVTGSPFDPAQVNSKTGLWGVLIAKTVFTAGKYYIALWEMTVDSITTAKVERFLCVDAADYKATGFSTHSAADVWTTGSRELSTPNDYKADVSALATQTSVDTIDGNVDSILTDTGTTIPATITTLQADVTTIDGNVDAILVDTNEIQGKLPSGDIAETQYTLNASIAEDATNIKLALWINKDGQRMTTVTGLYDIEIINGETDTQLLDIGDDTSDTPDGIFYKEIISTLVSNTCYYVKCKATIGGSDYYLQTGIVKAQ